MKTSPGLLLITGLLLAGCSDKENTDKPQQETDLLQKTENPLSAFTFSYNEKDQLTEVNWKLKSIPERLNRVNLQYNNNAPATAMLNMQKENGSGTYLSKRTVFTCDNANRITMAANTNYNEDGTEESKDSVDYFYNANGRMLRARYRRPTGVNDIIWTMNEQGNLIHTDKRVESASSNVIHTYSMRYDNLANPYNQRSLGIMLYIVLGSEVDKQPQLLSTNNLVHTTYTYLMESKNGNGEVTGNSGSKDILNFKPVFDVKGKMISSGGTVVTETIVDGHTTNQVSNDLPAITYTYLNK